MEQAIHQRSPAQGKRIHRSDRGSQYLSSKYTKRLPEAKTVPSVGSVGDSYDNALAETINGNFKTELIRWLQSQVITKPFTRLEPASWGGLTDDYGSCIVPLANVRLLGTVFVLLQKPLRMKQNKSSAGLLYTLPALTILMAIVFIPIMVVVNYSVQDVFSGNFFLWAGPIWFEKTLRSVEFWQTLGRSALYSTLVIAIEIPLGVFIALKIPKSGAAATLYIIVMAIPLLIPWFVVGLIWKIFADPVIGPFGASMSVLTSGYDLNSPLVAWLVILLVDVWHWTGLVVLLSYAGLVAIPETMYQAARIDSASRWAVFRYVELPRLRHVLLIALLLRLTDSLMVYIEPFMITRGGPDQATTFLSMDLIQTAMYQFDFGEASASALIYLLIMLTLSWALYSALMARND